MSMNKMYALLYALAEVVFPFAEDRAAGYEQMAKDAHGKLGTESLYFMAKAETLRDFVHDLKQACADSREEPPTPLVG